MLDRRSTFPTASDRRKDPVRELLQGPLRGTRPVLATIPQTFTGDVRLVWTTATPDGERRRRLEYRPELGIEAEVTNTPAVWFTFDLPLIEAAVGSSELRVFRKVPRWSRAPGYRGESVATDADPSLLPRVVDGSGVTRQVLERADVWEELPRGASAGAYFEIIDADATVRVVTERLGVFVVTEQL